jgi:hypothetical protein
MPPYPNWSPNYIVHVKTLTLYLLSLKAPLSENMLTNCTQCHIWYVGHPHIHICRTLLEFGKQMETGMASACFYIYTFFCMYVGSQHYRDLLQRRGNNSTGKETWRPVYGQVAAGWRSGNCLCFIFKVVKLIYRGDDIFDGS